MLGPLAESYRKIRNTVRYMLGNLSGFDAAKDRVAAAELLEIDRFALSSFNLKARRILKAYDAYEFFAVYHTIVELCAVDLSAFYFDVLKDRLYTARKDGPARRSAQTVLDHMCRVTLRLLAPVLAFTAEEAWRFMPGQKDESVHLAAFPSADELEVDQPLVDRWRRILAVRDEVLKPLEQMRKEKKIGQALEATWGYAAEGELAAFMDAVAAGGTWPEVTATSGFLGALEAPPAGAVVHAAEAIKGLTIYVLPAAGAKCARCWKYDPGVGRSAAHPDICPVCADAISGVRA
jgi:isoleucyl-tRNA synthetase